jgi:hypothetical protein
LEWDRRAGYWLYQIDLKNSGDKRGALDRANEFYKWFGYLFAGFSAIYLLVVIAALIATLTGAITVRNV